MQLATIKAKSEALRLRQQFELDKFRKKYASKDAEVSPRGKGDPATEGELADSASEHSKGSLSIGSEEAFDEPLKVRPAHVPLCYRLQDNMYVVIAIHLILPISCHLRSHGKATGL